MVAGLAGTALATTACGEAKVIGKEFSPTGEYTPDEEELALMELYRNGRLITARRKADELLELQPYSIIGHYVLGQVLRESEGQLPKSMKHLGRARELFETRYPSFPLPEGPMTELHREILFAGQGIAGELEQFEYQLSLLDFYDSLYSPELIAEHAWPLMRLGRYDEARGFAKQALESTVAESRSLGLNAMCAIEGEAATRQPRFEACREALEDAQNRAVHDDPKAGPHERTPVAVHAYNAAQAAAAVLRPDEVERAAIAGTARLDFTPANPWRVLMRLYLDGARIDDGAYALTEMLRWRKRQPPYLRDQDRAQTDVAQATFLLVIGRTEPGLRLVDRALKRPDRRGLTSSTKEQATGAHALLRMAIRRADDENRAERASWGGGIEDDETDTRTASQVAVAPVQRVARNVADKERIRNILVDEERMLASFRPYVHGGLEPVPTWLVGDLIDVVGAGVSRVMIERAREAETEDGLSPYYDALQAEVALAEGNEREARRLVELALTTLPEEEVLLRARVAAVGAEAAAGQDDDNAELDYLAQAMQLDAGTVRRRGLSIPAIVRNNASGAIAAGVTERLADSPRLREGDGFAIDITGADAALQLCLSSRQGTELSCTTVDWTEATTAPPPGPDGQPPDPDAEPVPLTEQQSIARTLQAFHGRAFGFGLELSSIDLRSLDGTSVVSEEAARDRMKSVLDDISAVGD
ncbi:MAG: hypothetical protein AAF721_26510 [Myxococcota bacterium]